VSGGTRAVQMIKQVVTTLKMVPLTEAVTIPFASQFFDEEQCFQPTEVMETAATAMLNELARWAVTLRRMRVPAAEPVPAGR
jgi:NAD(P)H-dependent FMN reductase